MTRQDELLAEYVAKSKSASFRRLNTNLSSVSSKLVTPTVQLKYAYSLPASPDPKVGRASPGSLAQQAVRHGTLGEGEGKKGYSGRVLVRVTSYRRRLLDPDNLIPKYFLDCFRYAGVLRDDRADEIELISTQSKVRKKEDERTEIEVSPITYPSTSSTAPTPPPR